MKPYKLPPKPLVATRKEPPSFLETHVTEKKHGNKKDVANVANVAYVPTSPPASLRGSNKDQVEKKYKLPPLLHQRSCDNQVEASTLVTDKITTSDHSSLDQGKVSTVPQKVKLPPQSVHYQGRRTIYSNTKELPQKRKEPPTKIAQIQKPPRKRNKRAVESDNLCLGEASIILPVYENAPTAVERLPPDMLTKRHVVMALDGIVGQDDAVTKSREWIDSYSQKSSGVSKALLVVGPSGCGKTSIASCTFTDHAYKVYNFSCDDFDGQKMGEVYTIVNRSSAFEKFGVLLEDVNTLKTETQKLLVEIINGKRYEKQFGKKHWHAPIIMTCDLSSLPSLGPLAAVSEVVVLQRIQDKDLLEMFNRICEMEKLTVAPDIRDKAVKACGGDVRRLLNMLQFFALAEDSASLGQIDVSTIFYEQYSNFDLATNFIRLVMDKTPLASLSDMMDVHPVSLSSLLSQNHHKFHANVADVANVADHISFSEQFEHMVYKEGDWELQECATLLNTWGIATLLTRDTCGQVGKYNAAEKKFEPQLERSDYFSFKEKAKHRKKLLVSCSNREGVRGLDLIETSLLWCEMIKKHTSKVVQQEMVDYFNNHQYSYKDAQNIWKISHLSDTTMPNPRGKNSLRKLLKIK